MFFDLVYDSDPDFTIKNQLFFDRMDQYKTFQPAVRAVQQDVYVIEDKLTVTKRVANLPHWLRVNTLASINCATPCREGKVRRRRFRLASHRCDGADWRENRRGHDAEHHLISPIDNPDLDADGYPWGRIYRSEFSEIGLGLLFDIDVGARWNFLVGGRYDSSRAKNVDSRCQFQPGRRDLGESRRVSGRRTKAPLRGTTPSRGALSASYALTRNVRPYVTVAESSIVLDGNNNALSNDIIQAGHIGSASLEEVGHQGEPVR